LSSADPHKFVRDVQPLLERKDQQGLHKLLCERWPADQIVQLLYCDHEDARKVAALALSLVGCKDCLPALVQRLQDPDPVVNEMTEYAMWSIWLRMGRCKANHAVARGVEALSQKQFDQAIEQFTQAIELSPHFAEAYNQRAIAYYLKEEYESGIADSREAIARMDCHFGAWSGMGHCLASLGRLDEALAAYQRALEINPHLSCIRQAIGELQGRVRQA
jgi:tetratricopeptide (TPR) repeat protein